MDPPTRKEEGEKEIMKLKIENDVVLLNRKQFLEIKRLDHIRMNGLLTGLYREGEKRGEENGALSGRIENLKIRQQAWEDLIASLDATKGIGEVRKQSIKIQFRERFKMEDKDGCMK